MREVPYPLHPWVGCQVDIHEVIDKNGQMICRCSRANSTSSRWSEIPAWMFERTVCVTGRFSTAQRVDIGALRVPARLLWDAMPISIAQDLGAALGSHDSDQRVAHATPAKTISIEPIRSQQRAKSAKASLASATRRDAPRADATDGALDSRSCRPQPQS